MLAASDVVRLTGALVLCGLISTLGVGLLFPRNRRPNSISQVTATFAVPWSPRGLHRQQRIKTPTVVFFGVD